MTKRYQWVLFSCLSLTVFITPANALDPKDVFLVVNSAMPESGSVADHYLAKRKIPKENVISLDLPTGDEISRADYETKLLLPLRKALEGKKDQVKVLALVYGCPLRIQAVPSTDDEKKQLETIKTELEEAKKDPKQAGKVQQLTQKQMQLQHAESYAAVDSELVCLWWPPYDLMRWQPNPFHGEMPSAKKAKLAPGVMTCRIDGPTPAITKRMIDHAVEVETEGLKGSVAIDARNINFDPAHPSENGGYGYGAYDESMRETAKLLKGAGLTVHLENTDKLMAEKSHTDVAMYCGWYSVGNYSACCTYAKGAIAWHLASFEAATIHGKDSKLWCPNLLRDGACVTLGPVAEPYTVGFPKPAEFFGYIAAGETVIEAYFQSTVFVSWQMTLIGDPLYAPYKAKPILKKADVKPSPEKGKYLFR